MFENYKFLKKNIFIFFIIYSLFIITLPTTNALNIDKVVNFIHENSISPIIKSITNTLTPLLKQNDDNKLIDETLLLSHFSKQTQQQPQVQFQNEYINILNVANTESLENYLIYWRYGYNNNKQLLEEKDKNNLLIFLYNYTKRLIWINTIIRPIVLIFLWFPNFYGIGFYSGQTSEDICASLTAIPATNWSNIYFKPLCYELIAKKFDVFYYTTSITIYFLFLIWSLKKILKFVIKKFF